MLLGTHYLSCRYFLLQLSHDRVESWLVGTFEVCQLLAINKSDEIGNSCHLISLSSISCLAGVDSAEGDFLILIHFGQVLKYRLDSSAWWATLVPEIDKDTAIFVNNFLKV